VTHSHLDRVTCEDAFRKIDDYLDRELSDDELARIADHLAICAACASEFQFERSVLDGVRAKLRRVAAPPALLPKIFQLIRAERDGGRE
jgi:anti-sigma factor (TIGR02949 family)